MTTKRLVLAGVAMLIMAGCASIPKATVYKPNYPKKPVSVADLSFEKITPIPEKPEEWAKHVEDWQKAFRASLTRAYPAAKPVSAPNSVKEGLLAKPYVTVINRKWNAYFGGEDSTVINVELYDAATNEKVAEIPYVTDSSTAGWAHMSFGGRIEACADTAGATLGRFFKKNNP